MGFTQQYKAKLRVGELWLGRDGLYDSGSGIGGSALLVQKVTIQATAAANTDFVTMIPPGTILLRATMYTTVAFLGSTTVTIALGASAGDATYVSPVDCKAVQILPLTLVGTTASESQLVNMPALSSGSNLYIRLAQGGVPSATGTGKLLLEYA